MPYSTALLIALAFPAQDETFRLVWEPTPGPAHHEWVTAHHLFVDTVTRTVEDTVIPMNMRFSLRTERRLTVNDEVLRLDATRPTEVRREYQTVEMSAHMEPVGVQDIPMPTSDIVLTSEVAGKSVIWTWVPQEGQFGRYYDGVEAKESILPYLREDLGLRALLPGRAVQVGSTWKIDPLALRDVLEPGGRLSLTSDRGSRLLKRNIGAGMGGGLYHLFSGQATGNVVAKLSRVDGDVAVVTLTLDRVRYLADLANYVTENILGRESAAGLDITGGRLILDLNGEGTLFWDISKGRAKAFELKADQSVEMTFDSVHANKKKMVERMKMVGGLVGQYTTSAKAPR
jgi:hypothetical protein